MRRRSAQKSFIDERRDLLSRKNRVVRKMSTIKARLPALALIGAFVVSAAFAGAPAAAAGAGNTSWTDTFDSWVTPRDMSMYNKPMIPAEPERLSPEELVEKYPGIILLGENASFPDAGCVAVPGLPADGTAHVVVTEPAYFSTVPPGCAVNLTNLPPLREYALVTADPGAFVADAGSGRAVTLRLPGREFVLDLEPVPGPVAEGAQVFVKNESGTFAAVLPRMWSFAGTVAGNPESFASFTVDGEVILGTIRCGATSLVIDQAGIVETGGGRKVVHVVYDERDVVPPACGLNRFVVSAKSLVDGLRSGIM
jgi:hypothetical protein